WSYRYSARSNRRECYTPQIVAISKLVIDEGGQGKVDVAAAIEGHGDNEGGLSGLQTHPSPAHRFGQHPDTVERPAHDNIVPEVEASYSAGRFGNLPFTPQWGLTDSSRMDNSRECRDIMAKLFTPADDEFFNEGVRDESVISYDGALAREKSLQDRLEEVEEEKKEADNLNSSQADQIRQLEEALKPMLYN
ncbi:hypothetical protein Tco_0068152, partial [Tanacetum coccineum]